MLYHEGINNDTRKGYDMDYIIRDKEGDIFVEQEKNRIKEQIIRQYIALRKAKGLSQEDVANMTGIARPNIARTESGRNVPTIEVLTKLALALDMELEIKFVEKR